MARNARKISEAALLPSQRCKRMNNNEIIPSREAISVVLRKKASRARDVARAYCCEG